MERVYSRRIDIDLLRDLFKSNKYTQSEIGKILETYQGTKSNSWWYFEKNNKKI